MDTKTTINRMLAGNVINVPDYQRAYSWETSTNCKKPECQVNTFLRDIQDYVNSKSSSPYYFGHFLFEKTAANAYNIIDGQQRLTTITIFLASLFKRMEQLRGYLKEEENFAYQSMIRLGETYRFKTVAYDNQFFRDYIVDQTQKDTTRLDTISKERIADAFKYFKQELSNMSEEEVLSLLTAVTEASCSTHIVDNEVEAIQMFIFQNNRGKKPSNLEIIKAQFMYNIHLYGGIDEEKKNLLEEIKNRFEHIYTSISCIENRIDEDSVLTYTLRVFFNSLWERDAIGKINVELEKDSRIKFIKAFTQSLANSFDRLATFFYREKQDIVLHSVLNIADYGILMPFVIKAFGENVSDDDFRKMCFALESIFVRHRVIGTRADITSRLHEQFKNFDGNVDSLIKHVEWMKTRKDWWGYWNNDEFENSLQGCINHDIAKKLLWRYENFLISEGRDGYGKKRYDDIQNPHLEHIAPQEQNPNNGYFPYEDDWLEFVDCFGNYLLLNGSHNISIGNEPFEKKRDTYTQLRQQQEIRDLTVKDHLWDKEKILYRKAKIIHFLLSTY